MKPMNTLWLALVLAGGPAMALAQDNLIPDPGFDSDISAWTFNTWDVTWDGTDRRGSANSGSIRVHNTDGPNFSGRAPFICFPAEPGTVLDMGVWVWLGADEVDNATTSMGILQYASDDCSSEQLSSTFSIPPLERNEWTEVSLQQVTLHNTRSVRMALTAFRSDQGPGDVTALFDDAWYVEAERGRYVVDPSLSTSWYRPEESGHGVMLTMLDSFNAWMCWFAFDNAGEPAWLCGAGKVNALRDTLVFNEVFTVEGGMFPPDFDADLVEQVPWGTVQIEFASCRTATMQWSTTNPRFQNGSMPLTRLAPLWSLPCE